MQPANSVSDKAGVSSISIFSIVFMSIEFQSNSPAVELFARIPST